MSDLKSFAKGGWHPKGKDGGKESWRGDFKGINQVAGWMGKGKQPGEGGSATTERMSRPLATLKDPSSFGPPPKNVNYHGGAALPNEITPHTGGLGAPMSTSEIESARNAAASAYEEEEEAELEASRPAPPPLPFRSDRTGLRTDNLPPPPVHRDLKAQESSPVHTQPTRPSPSLPPRLPSRQKTPSLPTTSTPPPAYEAKAVPLSKPATPSLNQSAISRLGSAGVSVSSLGIGKKSSVASNDVSQEENTSSNSLNPWKTERSQNKSSTNQLSELQQRFQRMNSNSDTNTNTNKNTNTNTTTTDPNSAASPPPMPTWQQTQSTFRTAQNLQHNPGAITLSDAQNAATTAQSAHTNAQAFRTRHAETINAAQTRATQLNKKYDMTGKLNKFLEDANNDHDRQQAGQTNGTVTPVGATGTGAGVQANNGVINKPELTASIARKPPPPPPPKKPASMQAPPPVPLGTKPSFT